MKAKEVYARLDTGLKAGVTALGFKKKRSSRLVYQRLIEGGFQTIWFQCDKNGWDNYAGGKFYVNFTFSKSADYEAPSRHEERLNFFLSEAELEKAHQYTDEIVRRIPKPPPQYFDGLYEAFQQSAGAESAERLIAALRARFEPDPLPFRANQDFGLRYWLPSDLADWASFIAPVIPRALEQLTD